MIREGLAKYKQFVYDLLVSTYDAARGETDVLIQNPPAMSGVHIVEKMKALFERYIFLFVPLL
jgi:hypothetical protein